MLFGCWEDYKRNIIEHLLILTRTTADRNATLPVVPVGGNPPENYRITLSRTA